MIPVQKSIPVENFTQVQNFTTVQNSFPVQNFFHYKTFFHYKAPKQTVPLETGKRGGNPHKEQKCLLKFTLSSMALCSKSCHYCGFPVGKDYLFCRSCGTKLITTESATVSAANTATNTPFQLSDLVLEFFKISLACFI